MPPVAFLLRAAALLVAATLVGTSSLSAQEAAEPARLGDRVRVEWTAPDGRAVVSEGELMTASPTEVALLGRDREVTVVPVARIGSVQKARGIGAVGGVAGFVVGFAASAALAGAAAGESNDMDMTPLLVGFLGGVLGATAGARMAGARWRTATLPEQSPTSTVLPALALHRPGPSGGVAVRLGVRWAVGR